jgi:hypothetical protein
VTGINDQTVLAVTAAFMAGADQDLAPVGCVFMDKDGDLRIAFNTVLTESQCDKIGHALTDVVDSIRAEIAEAAQ